MMPAPLFGGAPYEYSAVVPEGSSLLFTAGACPLDGDGRIVGVGDVEAQARAAVDNLLAALEAHGAGAADLVRTTIYVVGDRDALARAWTTIASVLAPHRPPSTLLGVQVLGWPDQLVEIDGIATVPATAAVTADKG
jgi:enamine deaminase RidA (YjgF/YER057c/UK114 family)